MLSLTAKIIHLDGQTGNAMTAQFGAAGGSIGRDARCDMVLPERWVSRVQARIAYAEGRYVLHNASVSNPMYVNGMELSPGSSQVIADGHQLQVGSYVIGVAELEDGQRVARNSSAAYAHPETPPTPPSDSLPQMDPLLAFGGNGNDSASPFADLLAQASPIAPTVQPESQAKHADRRVPSTAGAVAPFEPATGMASPPATQTDPMGELPPPGARGQTPTPSPLTAVESNLLAGNGTWDPDSPFGDLLGQALPIGNAPPPAPDESAPAGHSGFGAAAVQNRLPGAESMLSHAPPGHEAEPPKSPINLFEPQKSQKAKAPEPYVQPLSALAGTPFADLLAEPVESHLARAPASKTSMAFIPEDFNPFAGGGVAQRNTADPLTPLGRNIRGLDDVQPDKTVDSIYSPGAESATALVVDPLAAEAHASVLQVGQETDPMKLFANKGQALEALTVGDLSNAKSTSDRALEMTSYFLAPTALPDPAMAPQRNGKPEERALPAPVPVPADPAPPLPRETPERATPAPTIAPADVNTPLAANTPSSPALGAATAIIAPHGMQGMSSDAPPNLPGSAAAAPVAENTASVGAANPPAGDEAPDAGHNEALIAAFKRGAGLQDWAAQSLTPELMEILGQILASAAQGVVSLLAARATVKQEIHLSVTLISPKANNPLKFLPDGHTALLQMLGPPMPGFMPPVDAMKEAFDDLVTHQTAIAAGTQATLEALFERFDPSVIESQHPQSGLSEKMSQTLHHARLWNTYKNQYRLIKDEVQDDFFKRLGAEFHAAYNLEYTRDLNGKSE